MKKVRGRLMLLVLIVVLSVICVLPSYQPLYRSLPGWAKSLLPNKGITLGLDLQGGIHMVMEVDEDRAVEIAVDRSVTSLQDVLVDKKIPVESVTRTAPTRIMMKFLDAQLKEQIQKLIDDFPTSATVQATTDTTTFRMSRDDFKRITSERTEICSKLWESIARSLITRIRKTGELVKMYYGLNKALCENEEFRQLYTSWNFHVPKQP